MLTQQDRLEWASRYKWLGLLRTPQDDWLPAAVQRIAVASASVATLAGLVSSYTIPLALGDLLFRAKAHNSLAFGRWLWGIFPATQLLLDSALVGWAKCLLGSDDWRSSAVALGEMAWSMSGAASAVLEVAKKRAKL
jgi:hypothetical protein